MKAVHERRNYPRARLAEPIQMRHVISSHSGYVLEVQNDSLNAIGQDISESGIQARLDTSLKPGTILKVVFKLDPSEAQYHEAYVDVLWARKGTVGLRFLVMDEVMRKRIRGLVENIVQMEYESTPRDYGRSANL